MNKHLIPSFISLSSENGDFNPFHDYFPERLKEEEQYWYFGELLKDTIYLVEDGEGRTFIEKLIELRMIWKYLVVYDQEEEIKVFLDGLRRQGRKYYAKYETQDGGISFPGVSEGEKVPNLLIDIDTDGFSQLIKSIQGRDLRTFEDLQFVQALQRLKGTGWSVGSLSMLTDKKVSVFWRRFPTGRRVKVRRYQFGVPRYGDPITYSGVWVYGENVYLAEVEQDEYYVGEGWEKYYGIIGKAVRYDGSEVYTDSGDLVYGEVRFYPDPCEVWVVYDASQIAISADQKELDAVVDGIRKVLSPCSKVTLFPLLSSEEEGAANDEVEVEEVRYYVAVIGENGETVLISPDELSGGEMVVESKVGEYDRRREVIS